MPCARSCTLQNRKSPRSALNDGPPVAVTLRFLVIAACLLKKDWWIPAGMLLGWAVCSRVFPAVFAFGIGAKLLLDLVIDRRINWNCVKFLAACGLTIAVCAGASWLETGTAYWREFIAKISEHNEELSAWRIGFKYIWLLSYRGSMFGRMSLDQQYAEWINWYHALQLGVLLISVPLVRRLETFEAFCFGIVPAFFLVAATYYYYIMILVPMLFFVSKLDRWQRAAGAALILIEGMVAHYGHHVWDRSFQQFFLISCMVMAIVIWLMIVSGFEGIFSRPKPEGDPGEIVATPA